jgi:mevalonate pyrophosphate decarboxylase
LKLDPAGVSEVARLGAGSATRSVTGGFSEWVTDGPRSYGRQLAGPGDLDWSIVAVVPRHDVPTEGVHREAMASPFFAARLEYLPRALEQMRKALQGGDAEQAMELAERDTLNLHAITLTMPKGLIAWRGVTVETMHRVRALRKAGTPCYFSIDTGAAVYVNTMEKHVPKVEEALREVADDAQVMRLKVGPASRTVSEHLF